MNLEKLDYFIAQLDGDKKPKLFQCIKTREKEVIGEIPDMHRGTAASSTFRIPYSDILANLGSRLRQPASVYGVKLNPVYRTDTVKRWGKVQVCKDAEPDELEYFYSRLTVWGKRLHKLNYLSWTFDTFIEPEHGRHAGYYKYSGKEDGDSLVFHPVSLKSEANYVITHELGHNIWFRKMSRRQQVRWITLYANSVLVTAFEPDEVERLLKDFSAYSGDTIKAFQDNLEEKEASILEQILAWTYSVHFLNRKHLDAILLEGNKLSNLLPSARELESGEPDVLVSDYACKCPEELFAEAFSFAQTEKSLPVKVSKLLSKTLRLVAAS